MMRPPFAVLNPRLVALSSVAVLLWACKENLPSGPDTITVAMSVTSWQDTLVVGRTKLATAKTVDGLNREVQALHYTWSFADSTIARFTTDSTTPGSSVVTALKPGLTTATVSLPDARFVVPPVTKNLRVVIAGLSVLSAHDTTLTAINDTARVIAGSLVQSGASLVTRAGQGIKWVQRGAGTVSVIGTGDTIRVIARAAGVDTLIATHDFCLAGARCADTVYARVRQALKLTLSSKSFVAWTFGDTAGPSIVLADRRGTGSALASVRLVPVTAADSARVTITSTLGTTNATTGAMAAPKMVSSGNGTARVAVVGRNPDGTTADSDTITYVIRQIAVRSSVEPLQSQLTEIDTIPVKVVARDSRGFAIGDAVFQTTLTDGLALTNGNLTVTVFGTAFTGSISTTLSGAALAASNPGAPATTLSFDTAFVSVVPAITYSADVANRTQSILLALRAPCGSPLANRWVRFKANAGLLSADSVLSDAAGSIAVTWTPTTAAGRQILTGILQPVGGGVVAAADSAGQIVVRRTVTITSGVAVAATSGVSIRNAFLRAGDTATVTVRMKDAVGNVVTTALATDVALVATGGSLGITTCSLGICTAVFTATLPPTGTITAQIGGASVGGSPVNLVITAGAPAALLIITQPAQAGGHDTNFTTQPVLNVVDAYGNIVATNSFTITATANVVAGIPTLTGTLTETSAVGIVTFTNLGFGGTAGTITITFTGNDGTTVLTAATSANVINP